MHAPPNHRPWAIVVPMRGQPYNAFKFIRQNGLSGNLVVRFRWAQAAIWYLYPDCRVAFDRRFRTVYPLEIEDAYFGLQYSIEDQADLLDRYDTHMVLMHSDWEGIDYMNRRQDWRKVYESAQADDPEDEQRYEQVVLFVKRGVFPEFEARVSAGTVTVPPARKSFHFGEAL